MTDMLVHGHGDAKYRTGRRLTSNVDWSSLRVECWRHEAGRLNDVHLDCTEVAVLMAGQLQVRRTGNGETQEAYGRPGTAWICPAGTTETDIQLSAPMEEVVHIFVPATLMEETALTAYDIDPGMVRLGYAGGLDDALLVQVAATFRSILERGIETTDRLLADGMRAALAAHLVSNYSAERWQPKEPRLGPALEPVRLKRVLDYIDAHLSRELSLDELAAEACLSQFHFARLFRDATGLTPHRFVTERRVAVAKERLRAGRLPLAEIALLTGFGSQSNFNRVFKRVAGCSPGQFRR
ncbi:AraC family transcriptional regulator [Sphingomonas sp.]|uniref:AraC family transcriptional regulator n=1 Tax=Sphingomonas sp. TaxID=28214 RepID=UPI0031DF8C56